MKKIVLVLCTIIVFAVCSCSKDNDDIANYSDNKLIEGTWYSIVARDSMVYTFMDNKATSEYYAFVIGLDTLKFEGKDELGHYLLTDSLIILPQQQGRQLTYRLGGNANDSLYIEDLFWVGLKKVKK